MLTKKHHFGMISFTLLTLFNCFSCQIRNYIPSGAKLSFLFPYFPDQHSLFHPCPKAQKTSFHTPFEVVEGWKKGTVYRKMSQTRNDQMVPISKRNRA